VSALNGWKSHALVNMLISGHIKGYSSPMCFYTDFKRRIYYLMSSLTALTIWMEGLKGRNLRIVIPVVIKPNEPKTAPLPQWNTYHRISLLSLCAYREYQYVKCSRHKATCMRSYYYFPLHFTNAHTLTLFTMHRMWARLC